MNAINYHPYISQIVGTISIKNHNALNNAGWIYRFAIHPNYSLHKIAEPMLNMIAKMSRDIIGYRYIEAAISEFQENERDFYDSLGYETRQIYHKEIIGRSLTITKSQLRLKLFPTEEMTFDNANWHSSSSASSNQCQMKIEYRDSMLTI